MIIIIVILHEILENLKKILLIVSKKPLKNKHQKYNKEQNNIKMILSNKYV